MKNMVKWHKSLDINGNGIAKVFYNDGTTEMVRGGKFNELENKNGNSSYSKFYHSESGLRNSK
jgi:hypothetical protein